MQAFYRRPVAFAAFLAVMAALLAYRLSSTGKLICLVAFAALAVGTLIFAVLKRGGKRRIELLLCLLAVTVALTGSYLFFDVRYRSYSELVEQTVEVEGTVLERGASSAMFTTLRVSLDRINGERESVDAVIELDYQSALQVGDTFCIKGVVRAFARSEQFDEARFRLSDGCLLVISCASRYDCEIGEPDQRSLRVLASGINARLSYGLSDRVGGEEGALAAALLLGNRTMLSGITKLDFQYAGISHLLALSGLHVSILIAFVEFVLRLAGIGKRGRAAIIPFIALGYLTLTGFSPSTCRAVLMAIVTYVALLFGERYDSFTALMLSLFVTLAVTPYAILDLSLWMSYLSASAIVLIYPLIARSFDGWYRKCKPHILVFRTLRALVSALIIGLSANLALVLLSALVFGTTSLASVPATMLLSIPVTGLLVLSLLCVLLPFVDVLSVLCGAFARLVLWWSDLFAVPNGVLLPLNDAWSITILILMTAVIAVLAVVRLRRFVCLLIPPALFLVAVCVSLCVTRWGFSDMHVDVIQTGHGNLYLYTEDGKALLINDADGAVAKDYEIKQAALAQRCTVIDDAVICRYYNQATYFIGSLSESIYLQRLHLPTPSNAREAAIAARLAEEASHYGIEVLYDAEEILAEYMDGDNT